MSQSALPIERRRNERSNIAINCILAVNDGPFQQGRTHDISPNAVAIIAQTNIHEGDVVDIIFDDYGRHRGRVSRVFEDGFAVELPSSSLATLVLSGD
ncbi:MAG: PilZ domain-containing protein [Parvularculaceae bacterium]